ncbi:hypothetical protein SCACP_08350 [Sporomusa carbonis]|uniref:hypothetical protein n=1 Tax=Sporomusa carbonis TaxID=3076075 RepID=UPI003A6D53A9
MSGTYWYYGLVVASLVLLIAALQHRRDWKLLVLHLSIFSLIHPFEVVVLTTNGYVYLPGILPAAADNFAGAFISDFFIIPASAVFISAFSLSWRFILCFAALFTGIDWYFTSLGIYQHFWWKSIYTGIGLIVLYAISAWLWSNLHKSRPPLLFRLLIIHFTYFALQSAITFAVNRGGQLFTMQMASLPLDEPDKMMNVLISIYQLIVSATVVLCMGLKLPFRYRTLGIGVIVGLNWVIEHFGIFVPQANISPYHIIFVPVLASVLLQILFKITRVDYLFPKCR